MSNEGMSRPSYWLRRRYQVRRLEELARWEGAEHTREEPGAVESLPSGGSRCSGDTEDRTEH